MAAIGLLSAHVAAGQSRTRPAPHSPAVVTLQPSGLTFSLPPGWRKTSDAQWSGPNRLKLWVHVAAYRSEYGNLPIDEETKSFYEEHRKANEEDLRYLEVDGINGVHYLRSDRTWDDRYQMYDAKMIIWNAQWMSRNQRYVVTVDLFAPAASFSTDREVLYEILESIKLRRYHR